jgi:hypothetical protein
LSYRGHAKGSHGVKHRHGTFKWRSCGKQWIGGNQFVNASNNYEMPTKTEKEPEKPFEPRQISHREKIQRLNYHKFDGSYPLMNREAKKVNL